MVSFFPFMLTEAISGITLSGPKGILIADNSSAKLSCQATQGNVTDRVWLKDGKPLSPDSHVKFSNDSSSISIEVLKKEDNGEYICQLSNSVSSKEANFTMVVVCKSLLKHLLHFVDSVMTVSC